MSAARRLDQIDGDARIVDGWASRDDERATSLPALIWMNDILPATAAAYLIKGLLGRNSLAVCYGESNSGKTFLALDLALHVAQGNPWRGLRTVKGLVVYVAGEGSHSVLNRLSAYRQHVAPEADRIPFAVLPVAVNLLAADDVSGLMDAIRSAQETAGEPLALIVVDTLARSMAGGSENDSQDMGRLVRAADLLRETFGATVLFVHHSGKDQARGARGHSSLRAAVDTEIEVTGLEGIRSAKVMKQRDFGTGDAYAFELETVTLGRDQDGDPITSCIVRHRDDVAGERRDRLTDTERKGLETLREAIKAHGEYPSSEVFARNKFSGGTKVVNERFWRDIYYRRRTSPTDSPEAARKAFQRVRDKLQMSRMMQADAGFYWLVDTPGQAGHSGTTQ